MRQVLKRMAMGVTVAAAMTLAQATPMTWTLNNVKFNDGSTANGSFVFDASTGTYMDVLITTGAASYETGELVSYPFGVDATGIESQFQ